MINSAQTQQGSTPSGFERCRSTLSSCTFSQAEEAAVQRRLHHVHAPSRGLDPQLRSQRCVPGHEPPPQPLLYLLLTQHLSHGGSAQRAQQHGGLCQVTAVSTQAWMCTKNIRLIGPIVCEIPAGRDTRVHSHDQKRVTPAGDNSVLDDWECPDLTWPVYGLIIL